MFVKESIRSKLTEVSIEIFKTRTFNFNEDIERGVKNQFKKSTTRTNDSEKQYHLLFGLTFY
jgi:hypothetical protein